MTACLSQGDDIPQPLQKIITLRVIAQGFTPVYAPCSGVMQHPR